MYDITQLRPSWIRKIHIAEIDGVAMPGPCWLWRGARTEGAGPKKPLYGRIQQDGRLKYAHRVIYEALAAPIPPGLQIDHLCKQTECVNPAHLEPVSAVTNVRRSSRAMQTHCRNGHPLSGVNLYLARHPKGVRRVCRTCRDANMRAFKERRAARQAETWKKYGVAS